MREIATDISSFRRCSVLIDVGLGFNFCVYSSPNTQHTIIFAAGRTQFSSSDVS